MIVLNDNFTIFVAEASETAFQTFLVPGYLNVNAY